MPFYTKPIAGEAALKPPSDHSWDLIDLDTKPIAGEAALKLLADWRAELSNIDTKPIAGEAALKLINLLLFLKYFLY